MWESWIDQSNTHPTQISRLLILFFTIHCLIKRVLFKLCAILKNKNKYDRISYKMVIYVSD